ncbi:MAG: 4Fe-4S binding protein [Coriobacteriia bacterium]|nr:4Fe-4S binding protein [Coriobacteriia bacterium]
MTFSRSRVRRVVQLLLLLAFAGLTVSALEFGEAWLPSSLFSRLDPLVGLAATLASRAFIMFWAASLLTVLFTIAFGRAWCGWICPLGTVLDVMPAPERFRRKLSPRWSIGKFATLAFVLVAALFGNLGPMILDPITIVMRPLQELGRPFVGSDALSQSVGVDLGRDFVPSVAFLSLAPLLLVLALNLFERRLWCRGLCPLGGLLGLVSKLPGVRRRVDTDACTSCARCSKVCPTSAIDRDGGFNSDPAECIACLSCTDACQTHANAFGVEVPRLAVPRFEPSRRDALVAAGATGMGLAVALILAAQAHAEIMRPPSTDESRLARLCVRCGACYGDCPTGALRPSVSFGSEAGPWTPMLDERPPHCSLNCNLCAKSCPTDALHTPTEDEVLAQGLGVRAEVDRDRCRAWASNRQCMDCQKVCPIAGAILGEERPADLPSHGGRRVLVPVVDTKLCIGCNLCATACVVRPAAIGAPLPPHSDTPQPRHMGMPPAMRDAIGEQ